MGWESSGMVKFDLGPSFKVKRWFTGLGELSFWWIQICICSPMRRSSFNFLGQRNSLEPLVPDYAWSLECSEILGATVVQW